MEKIGLLKHIDMVVASAKEGVAKPDLRIFQIALDRANCKAENAVMVGDRIDNDILPANQIGMTSVWIKQGLGGLCDPTCDLEIPDYTINDLSELKKYFRISTSILPRSQNLASYTYFFSEEIGESGKTTFSKNIVR